MCKGVYIFVSNNEFNTMKKFLFAAGFTFILLTVMFVFNYAQDIIKLITL